MPEIPFYRRIIYSNYRQSNEKGVRMNSSNPKWINISLLDSIFGLAFWRHCFSNTPQIQQKRAKEERGEGRGRGVKTKRCGAQCFEYHFCDTSMRTVFVQIIMYTYCLTSFLCRNTYCGPVSVRTSIWCTSGGDLFTSIDLSATIQSANIMLKLWS